MLFNTAPDGTITSPALPETTPPAGFFGAVDPTYEDGDIHAVVTVRIAVTRDMLAAALEMAAAGNEEGPDSWSVQYIRESVECSLTYEKFLDLEQDAERFAALRDDASVADVIRAIYRAVDRSYPRLAPKGQS